MKMEPLGDRIIVEPMDESENKSAGGIIIPDTAKEKPLQGVVVEVGPGNAGADGKPIPMQIRKGDKVLYGKFSGTELKLEGKQYLILREIDVLAKFV